MTGDRLDKKYLQRRTLHNTFEPKMHFHGDIISNSVLNYNYIDDKECCPFALNGNGEVPPATHRGILLVYGWVLPNIFWNFPCKVKNIISYK